MPKPRKRTYIVTQEGQRVHRVTGIWFSYARTRCGLDIEDHTGALRKLGKEYRDSGRIPSCTRCTVQDRADKAGEVPLLGMPDLTPATHDL